MNGYYGKLLDVNLTTGEIKKTDIPKEDLKNYLGGRGLGTKILWDRLPNPGIDPLSPENVLLFMPGPFSGFPIPSSSRSCVVTKSPRTSPLNSSYPHASTVTYTNMGGFVGPELRFAGYDGLVITGKAEKPVYIFIEDDVAEIRDASHYWGMATDEFDKKIVQDLGDRRFETCYIGPAGENMVSYACILNTAARAAGRGGAGCVMGSKNLKAIAVRGTQMPGVADHPKYVDLLEKIRQSFMKKDEGVRNWRFGGTANALARSSEGGTQAVKNYREGTYEEIEKIGTLANREKVWKRDFACYSCQLACKKSGIAKGAYGAALVHDGPEYETGTMLGANLLISDLEGLQKCIFVADDLGLDIISVGNVIGFLMECYEKKLIDNNFLDGIELTWGNVDATLKMLKKIAAKEGIGLKASEGVKALAKEIGQGSEEFAIHVKGHELAAWNVHAEPEWFGISYTMANRGACHMNGGTTSAQDNSALRDSIGACSFASRWYKEDLHYRHFLTAITGIEWTEEEFNKAGERIFNMEKMFNYREGFRREDDVLPERFFTEAYTTGPKKGAVVNRSRFQKMLDDYYLARGWDKNTSMPKEEKLKELGLEFTLDDSLII